MMKLYHVLPEGDPLNGSREAAKASIALRETGVEFEIIPLNRTRDMRPPDGQYRTRINPMGTVPALDDDGFLLLESGAILRHLAEKYPEAELLPNDPKEKAKVQQWVFWEGTTYVLAICNLCMVHPVKQVDAPAFESIYPFRQSVDPALELRIAYEQVAHRHGVLDGALAGKKYIANNAYSIADIALGSHVALAGLLDLALRPFKNLTAWLRRLSDRAAWQTEPVFTGDFHLIEKKGLI